MYTLDSFFVIAGPEKKSRIVSEDEKRRAEKEVQSLTDEYIGIVNELRDKKVEEIKKV